MEQGEEERILTRARAAARLRARHALASAERRAVRDARREVGASLRRARRARSLAPAIVPITAPVSLAAASGRPLRRLAPLAVAAALVAVGLLALAPQDPATAEAGGMPPAAEAAPVAAARENATSRGRSFATVAFVAVAEPTPEPTPEPSAEPTPAPAQSVAAAPRVTAIPRATAGTGTGGGTSGAGAGGNGRGASPAPTATAPPPTPTPSPTLRPTPSPTVAPRPANMARFTGRVIDSRTGRSISGVCVIVGVRECNERDVYTDANGRFTIDLPVGSNWDVNFGRTGYVTGYRRLVSSAPRTTDIGTVRLVARP